MTIVEVSLLVSACIFAGSLAGLFLHWALPDEHMTKDTLDVVRLAIGMISVLASLVLGLLIATAKTSFDTTATEMQNYGADLILLSEAFRDYGSTANTAGAALRAYAERVLQDDWPQTGMPRVLQGEDFTAGLLLEHLREAIRALKPVDAGQTWLKDQALQVSTSLLRQRSLLIDQREPSVRPAMLAILVIWIVLIFVGFGLNAPRNGTIIVAFAVCALAIGGAIFLVLELDSPFRGIMRISNRSITTALTHMPP
ncbi:MAG: hypothetical protein ABI224_16415 [Acetobacteraceae bacterium]